MDRREDPASDSPSRGQGPRPVTVLVRAKDEAASLPRLFDILDAQTVAPEVVFVDSGSTDGGVAIARERGAVVIEIPASSFTYGYALNVGCEAASAPIVVALSAHAFPYGDGWLERLLEHFSDEKVACVCGDAFGPDGREIDGTIIQDLAFARQHPFWGYSNSAGGFRRSLWEQHHFREDMPFTEDKEWAWHFLSQGWTCVVDRSLVVEHSHNDDPLPDIFRRAVHEFEGYKMFTDVPPWRARDAIRTWWSDPDGYERRYRARLSYRRAIRLAGRYVGRRS